MREEGTTRPSPRAVQRLAVGVGDELADLRAALRHALAEADRHEFEGRPDRAAAVLAEQQQVLAAVHRRLEGRLAEAAVEREAEGVVDAVMPPRRTTSPTPTGASPPVVAGSPGDDGPMALRLLASAAAAIVGLALLLTPDGGGMLSAADSAGIERDVTSDDEGVDDGGTEPEAAAHRPEPHGDPTSRSTPPTVGELPIPEAGDLQSRPPSDEPGDDHEVDPADLVPSGLVDPGPVGDVLDQVGDGPAVAPDTDTSDGSDGHDEADLGDDDAEHSESSERPWRPGDLADEDDEGADTER